MLFSNRNEFLRESSRIKPIPPNIRNDIMSESGMTRSSSRLEKKIMKLHESPRIRKKSIHGDWGDSWPVWNRDINRHVPVFNFAKYKSALTNGMTEFDTKIVTFSWVPNCSLGPPECETKLSKK